MSFGLFQKMNMKFNKMGKKINLHLEYMRYLCNDMNIMLAFVNYRFIYNLHYAVINHVTSTMDIIVHFWGRLKITSILFFFYNIDISKYALLSLEKIKNNNST